ncbi:hypothetical protein BD324DRAFT_579245 [Kockovaella imperatae]|uniref:F-box domain-containing protein n=1 Tax=Kockovaella imperatae TaxID=4999 RepID=A0A1Y1UI37_9TREE|nr:hypothetical protein BD324DRAFT_579245 [Kockovaella imperatae]ORX37649.1 hypothetical protein BD324DRAFT_579245 [Kockovaella imperatae]
MSAKPRTTSEADRSRLLELPDEILARIFTHLDRQSLSKCYRINKYLNTLLSENSTISLHYTLMCNNLLLNSDALRPSIKYPNYAPSSSAQLLSTLRERLTRLRNFTPKSETDFSLVEPEGRLYEYLEGHLVRSTAGERALSGNIAFYDLNKLDDWEDVEEVEVEEMVQTSPSTSRREGREQPITAEASEDSTPLLMDDPEKELGENIRRLKDFGFDVAEFAIDPGQDLLVLVEVKVAGWRNNRSRSWTMHLHLMSLSTFEPHPLARQSVLDWPWTLGRQSVNLAFQICDDGLYVLSMNQSNETSGTLCGWQWTTGWRAISLRSAGTVSFESFVLLTPTSFAVPVVMTHLDMTSGALGELNNPIDLSFTHHIQLYAFPPFSSTDVPAANSSEPMPPPRTPTHIKTIDLPDFYYDLVAGIGPPRLDIRTDPPPRTTFPTFQDGHIQPFVPDPKTGLIIMNVTCQNAGEFSEIDVHFVICMLKETLTKHLPPPTSPLLTKEFARPSTVVRWESIQDDVRIFGPDIERPAWVCNVFHNRYVQIIRTAQDRLFMRLYDFDPLRVLKEIRKRGAAFPHEDQDQDGWSPSGLRSIEDDGVFLEVREGYLDGEVTYGLHDVDALTFGSKLPFLYVDRPLRGEIAIMDGERIVTMVSIACLLRVSPSTD